MKEYNGYFSHCPFCKKEDIEELATLVYTKGTTR
jgi:hypothetical protein|tara:strand:+ start:94 stop:195 length:102 start_codon:yes stop_codon:yes gene_type:complete